MTKKILLITTKGCEGCNIQRRILNKVIETTKWNTKDCLAFEERDIEDYKNSKAEHGKFDDFPTVLFISGVEVIRTITGTKPAGVIKRYLKELLEYQPYNKS